MHHASRFFVFTAKQKINLAWPYKNKKLLKTPVSEVAKFHVIETIENCIIWVEDTIKNFVALFFSTQFSQGDRDEVSDDLYMKVIVLLVTWKYFVWVFIGCILLGQGRKIWVAMQNIHACSSIVKSLVL